MRGDRDRAIADLARAIELDPAFIEAYVDRAEIYLKTNLSAKALTDLRASLKLPPRRLREREAQTRAAALLPSLVQGFEHSRPASPSPTGQPKLSPTSPSMAPSIAASKRVALVIGNSAYQHAGTLKNPANDARVLADAFRRIGFSEVIERYDLGLNAMAATLKEFGDRAATADWAVIYFAGHGLKWAVLRI